MNLLFTEEANKLWHKEGARKPGTPCDYSLMLHKPTNTLVIGAEGSKHQELLTLLKANLGGAEPEQKAVVSGRLYRQGNGYSFELSESGKRKEHLNTVSRLLSAAGLKKLSLE